MSLTWRLILSYMVIIAVALVLAFFTLLLVARPIQSRLATARLAVQSRLVGRGIDALIQRGATTEQVIRQFGERLTEANMHVLLVNNRGVILADSDDAWTGQQILIANTDQGAPPSGNFAAPNGEQTSFAATPVGPDPPQIYVLAIAPRNPIIPQFIREFGWGFVMAGIVAFFISVLVGALIARSFLQPLQLIVNATTAVAAGDYGHRVPEKGPPEVKRVAQSFNVMAGQVEAGRQATRDFVSNVSHELKTPLTSIQGFSQAIMEGATHNEADRRKAAGIIYQEAARMTRLVEDLLDLARIDSGQVVMQKTPLNLNQILGSTYNRLLPQAHQRQVKLVKQWDNLPPIVGDGDRLAQVFINLLDNAIRHTPAEGRVTLSGAVVKGLPRPRQVNPKAVRGNVTTALSERADFVSVSVSDTGPGIPPEDLPRIFERFYQVDKSRKRGKGTGLGLAIIKEIVDAHGGIVRAESVVGVGTKFTVFLPITDADDPTLISSR